MDTAMIVEMSMSLDERQTAAAMHGIATNQAFPVADRLQAALQALKWYEAHAPTKVWVLISDCGLNGPVIHGVYTSEPSLKARDEAIMEFSRWTGYQNTVVEEYELDV